MNDRLTLAILAFLVLAGCPKEAATGADQGTSGEAETTSTVPGADRDEHGCIPSAGYRWCDRTQQCERPWELAKREGFENTAEAFDAWCGDPVNNVVNPEEASVPPQESAETPTSVALPLDSPCRWSTTNAT